MLSYISDFIELIIRWLVEFITDFLPVKVIRDDRGRPFLYRYHLFSLSNDGPGICFHRFIMSDPDRGYHDHPWDRSISFILCGGYKERIYNKDSKNGYDEYVRKRFSFNYLNGNKVFHRVMIEEGKDAWTVFFFQKRSKTWGMIGLDGKYKPMSTQIKDNDGGWWRDVMKGLGVHEHLDHEGKVIPTVDILVLYNNKVLLIKRGKEPYKGCWALPGGRIEKKDQDVICAAKRELKEETNIDNVELTFLETYGNNKRDPRGFAITCVFLCRLYEEPKIVKAGDDAVDYQWFDVNDLPEIAFDHEYIIKESIKKES